MKENLLTKEPIFKALFVFSLPIIITNTVNMLFHTDLLWEKCPRRTGMMA